MVRILAFASVFFMSNYTLASNFQGQELLCTPHSAVGFIFDKNTNQWKPSIFTTDHKFAVLKSLNKPYTYEIKNTKTNSYSYLCKNEFSETGSLTCGMRKYISVRGEYFKVNASSGRYIIGHNDGFYDVLPENMRKQSIKKQLKHNQEREHNGEKSFPLFEPVTDETSVSPYMEIGFCEEL